MTHLDLVKNILSLQNESIILWKASGVNLRHTDFLKLVEENHAFNYRLWHAEDRARREDKGHTFVYQAKRDIDQYNQQRNNRMEGIDDWLTIALNPASPEHCPIHSETPGMMIDRLSILSLKIYHMNEQTKRQDADDLHRQKCQEKLTILLLQRQRLGQCLQRLLDEVGDKTRTFCVYHQFKMYNDPTLNPELYIDRG